jgi:hypothetical protein
LAIAVCWLLAASAAAADPEPDSPATRLFEVSGDGAVTTLFQHKNDWKVVPEDTLEHKFKDRALVVNDKLALMIWHDNVSVYALSGPRPQYRADILLEQSPYAKIQRIRVIENSAAAVTLEVQWTGKNGASAGTIAYRLTAGQPIMEIRPGEHVPHVVIAQFGLFYVVVPDFFGDDMVFSCPRRGNGTGGRVGLPTENFFLTLSGTAAKGDGMMMCVWPSNRQEAANFGDGNFVECVAGKPIWLAFLDTAGIWHSQQAKPRPGAKETEGRIVGQWKIPFSAKWRADLVGPELLPQSWFLDGQAPSPPTSLPQGERGVVVYPIDRDRQTPLDVFTPMDVLRNTLGVGPCQYILQTEGLGSENNPTPDNVMNWVEKQFAHKKQKKSADEIREMLGQMDAQVVATQGRIERYAAFARDLHKLVGQQELMPGGATGMMSLGDTRAYLDRCLADDAGTQAVRRTQQLTAAVADLIDKADAADACRKLGAEARQIGLAQERTLARCRLAVRWVREQAKMAATDRSRSELAKTVQDRAEDVLYAK